VLDSSFGREGNPKHPGRVDEQPSELAQRMQEFTARTQAVEAAAREWGIRPDYPEGVFVSAMLHTQVGFAELALSTAEALHATVAKAHATAEEELARQRVVSAETRVVLQNARDAIAAMETGGQGAIRRLEIEHATVTTNLINGFVPEMIKGVRHALVIKQHRYNHNVEWARGLGIGALMLCLVLSGYVWASWSDWGLSRRIESLGAAIEHCQLTSKWADDRGRRLCELSDFVGN